MNLKSVVSNPLQGRRRGRLSVRLCTGAIVMIALVALLVSPAPAAAFPDVQSAHPYFSAITDLAARGIITGKEDGWFHPSDPVMRQQFAKMIVKTMGHDVPPGVVCPFGDVDMTPNRLDPLYPAKYIAVCALHGITTGKTVSPPTFDPYGHIQRFQVMSMVVRAVDEVRPGLLVAPAVGFMPHWDPALSPQHGSNSARAECNGLLAGVDFNGLDPFGDMTRGEIAQVLHNVLVKLASSGTTYSLTTLASPAAGGSVVRSPDLTAYTAGSTVALTALPASGYTFSGWSGDASGTTNPLSVTMQANKTIVANFTTSAGPTPLYTLTITTPSGGGTVTRSPNKSSYGEGEVVVLTPVPSSGYVFHHWEGDAAGTTKPLAVVMDSNKSIAALFAPAPTYTLTVTTPGGGGTVTKSPNKMSYLPGEAVTLTAVPNSGYVFHHWGGDASGMPPTSPMTVIMTSNKSISAYFAPAPTYTLTISISGGGGTVAKSPSKTSYAAGETVTLTASPSAGYRFSYWSGDLIGTSNPKSLVMDSSKTVYAHFAALPTYTLTVLISDGVGTVSKSPNKTTYYQGETVALTATPSTGYRFSYWSGSLIGTSNPKSLVMDSNKTVYTHFAALATYTLTIEKILGEGAVARSPNKTTFYEGESVTLTAIPDYGWHFVRWWGSIASTANPCTFVMNSNKAVSCTFE